MHEGFNDNDLFAESISNGFTNALNEFVSSGAERFCNDEGHAILCSVFSDRLNIDEMRNLTEEQIIELQDSLEAHGLRLSRQQVVYCVWQTLRQLGAINEVESSESRHANDATRPESFMSKLKRAHDSYSYVCAFGRWLTVGPVLIGLGVTQAMYGWAGRSLGMRVGYSAACIVFGFGILVLIVWALVSDNEEGSDSQ